jgi:hypothetical protein
MVAMQRRARWLAALGTGIALALALSIAWSLRERAGAATTAATPRAETARAPGDEAPETPRAAESAGESDVGHDERARAVVEGPQTAREDLTWRPTIRVTGTVTGAVDAELEVDVIVTRFRPRMKSLDTSIVATGPVGLRKFSIDVTEAFSNANAWPQTVMAQARAGEVTGDAVEVPLVAEGAALTYERCLQLREVELTALVPAPSPAVVRGTVALLRSPRTGACATLIAAGEDGRPGAVLASRQLAHDGAFAIGCEAGVAVWLVVTSDGAVPATRDLGPLEPGVREVGEISFSPGAAIRGRVALDAKVAGVRATPADGAYGLGSECGTLVWNSGSFARPSGIVAVDEHGRFEIAGLAPGPYDLHLTLPSTAQGVAGAAMRVHAPADGVLFAPDIVEVKIELYRGGQPLRSVGVVWKRSYAADGFRSGVGSPDRAGRMSFWLEPGAQLDLEIEGRSHSIAAGPSSDDTWRRIDL